MTTLTPPKRPLGLIVALVASLIGCAYLYTENRTLAMKLELDKAAANHYKSAYRAVFDKDLMLTRDFTTMYVNNVKQLQDGLAAGKQKDALAGLDSANFFAGFLSRYTRDGNHFSSAEYAGKTSASKADTDKLTADVAHMQAKSAAVQKYLQSLKDLAPGASPPPFPN
ncbi:MAG: hypothetical protein H7338_17840 [Candidatus Sericytochromatia bacterium]|nr:hypothetical protein [Candidatus Sericytochromatia bacterium]